MLDLDSIEQIAKRNIWINRMHPTVKILVTFMYILTVASLGKYHVVQLLIMGVYPILLFSIAVIEPEDFLPKLIIPALMGVSLGIFNPIFNQEIITSVAGIPVTGGLVSFLSLLMKALFTVSASLLLVMTTTIDDLGIGLVKLKVPVQLILLLLLTYRYIILLLKETSKTIEAYRLRALSDSGIHFRVWGSLVGQIIIKSYQRAGDVYHAMVLRGYDGKRILLRTSKLGRKDCIYLAITVVMILSMRFWKDILL